MKIVFLDIDGVINRSRTNHHVVPTRNEPLPIPVDPACVACLNRLIKETGAKIVISSSWRKYARWQDLGPALVRHGLVGEVIGETPDLPNNETWLANWQVRKGRPFDFDLLERGWEIAEWLARFTEGICSCGHERALHECGTDECFYNDHPSGATGCLCRRFDGTPIMGFVILDDCSDMDALKPWLVLTNPIDGLDDPDVEHAKWILERSAKGIARAIETALGYSERLPG